MGKFVGLIGTISGKVGNVIFVKGEKGVSYGRTYQPVVANPKTEAQTNQRAKMNLVGRLSQVTPKELIIGLGGVNSRQRRSNFSSRLLNAAVVERPTSGNVIAKIAPEDIVFSQGAEVLNATMASPTITARSISVALTLSDATLAGKYGERIVVAIIDPSDKAGYSQVKYADEVLDNTIAKTITVNLGSDMADESLVCIYRLPFALNEDGMRLRSETLNNDGTDITARLLASGTAYTRGWGQSLLAASQVFTMA